MRTKKKSKLRNAEYYDIQQEFDKLYKKSKKNCKFTDLLSIITSEENIKLAYRNIKKNHGSKTAGTDGRTIQDLEKWQTEQLIDHIRKKLEYYKPQAIRRVEIPKPNGKKKTAWNTDNNGQAYTAMYLPDIRADSRGKISRTQ